MSIESSQVTSLGKALRTSFVAELAPLARAKALRLAMAAAACGLMVFSVTAHSAPSSLPILAKRVSTKTPSGKVRSSECMVHPDGVTVDHSVDGIRFSTERVGRIESSVTQKIREAASTQTSTVQRSANPASYSFVAFRESSSGIQETVVLASFDGNTGIEVVNPSPAAPVLKEILNTLCQ